MSKLQWLKRPFHKTRERDTVAVSTRESQPLAKRISTFFNFRKSHRNSEEVHISYSPDPSIRIHEVNDSSECSHSVISITTNKDSNCQPELENVTPPQQRRHSAVSSHVSVHTVNTIGDSEIPHNDRVGMQVLSTPAIDSQRTSDDGTVNAEASSHIIFKTEELSTAQEVDQVASISDGDGDSGNIELDQDKFEIESKLSASADELQRVPPPETLSIPESHNLVIDTKKTDTNSESNDTTPPSPPNTDLGPLIHVENSEISAAIEEFNSNETTAIPVVTSNVSENPSTATNQSIEIVKSKIISSTNQKEEPDLILISTAVSSPTSLRSPVEHNLITDVNQYKRSGSIDFARSGSINIPPESIESVIESPKRSQRSLSRISMILAALSPRRSMLSRKSRSSESPSPSRDLEVPPGRGSVDLSSDEMMTPPSDVVTAVHEIWRPRPRSVTPELKDPSENMKPNINHAEFERVTNLQRINSRSLAYRMPIRLSSFRKGSSSGTSSELPSPLNPEQTSPHDIDEVLTSKHSTNKFSEIFRRIRARSRSRESMKNGEVVIAPQEVRDIPVVEEHIPEFERISMANEPESMENEESSPVIEYDETLAAKGKVQTQELMGLYNDFETLGIEDLVKKYVAEDEVVIR